MRDRFYMPIRIPCTLMCGMKGLPPLKSATVGCVSMWTASLASRGGRICVISRRGHTHTPYTRVIPWVKSPERVRLTGGRACWRERGHSYRSVSSSRKLPPPPCRGTTCSFLLLLVRHLLLLAWHLFLLVRHLFLLASCYY